MVVQVEAEKRLTIVRYRLSLKELPMGYIQKTMESSVHMEEGTIRILTTNCTGLCQKAKTFGSLGERT